MLAPIEVQEMEKYAAFVAPHCSGGEERHEVFNVSPRLPTKAESVTTYPLVGTDLYTFLINQNLHIIPELIDIPKFIDAVSSTLSDFPTFAGRLRHQEQNKEWSIELSNCAIPVIVDRRSNTPLPDDWVVDPENLGAFIRPISFLNLVNHDEPLVSIKLSMFPQTRTTVIGIIASHHIADAFRLWEFTKTLSDYYQGIRPESLPDFVIPTPCPLPPLTDVEFQAIASMAADPRYQGAFIPPKDVYATLAQDRARSSSIKIRIPAAQRDKLTTALNAENPEEPKVSNLAAVAALIITTINRFIDKPINHVHVIGNVRSVVDPIYYGGNAVSPAVTEILTSEQQRNKSVIAQSIRQSLLRLLDPEAVKLSFPLMQAGLLDCANRGHVIAIPLPQGRALVNSNTRYDWNAVHFGCPGRARFHTAWFGDRSIRIFRSNPLVVDGQVVDSRPQSWDIFFRVECRAAKAVAEALEMELESLGSKEPTVVKCSGPITTTTE